MAVRIHDIVLVGGGLQSALVAQAVLAARPAARIALVEAAATLGGEHTWCFHADDVPPDAMPWVEPLVAAAWPAWDVRFPGLGRTFDARYACVTSRRLHAVVAGALRDRPGCTLVLGARATTLAARHVALDDGRVVAGDLVVDARGPGRPAGPCGWQKFVGLELELAADGAPDRPLVMDACIEQVDGFRFVYALPLGPRRVLVEDTYFSNDPTLDEERLAGEVSRWAAGRGLAARRIVRRERGVLPLPLTWSPAPPSAEGVVRAGYGGGFFHPTTGYSFPVAVRFAALVAATPPAALAGDPLRRFVAAHARQARFAVLLNRLLFGATAADRRRNVLERFHTLPADVVGRFYALATTPADRLRILCGRPPRGVSLHRALREVVSP